MITILIFLFPAVNSVSFDGSSEKAFLGSVQSPKSSSSDDTYNPGSQSHAMAVNNQLWSLKGMVSHYVPSTQSGEPVEELFAAANAVNFAIIVACIFVITITVLSSTAGLVLFVNSIYKKNVTTLTSDVILRELASSDSRTSIQHPGCTRVINKHTKSNVPQSHAHHAIWRE